MTELFASVILLDGRKMDIHNINLGIISVATFKAMIQKETQYDTSFFILHQILRIDKKELTHDQLACLCIDDYVKITDVVGAILMKLPK